MRELIKMVVVLTLLTTVSGGLLAGVRAATKDRIELQELNFVKGPVLKMIFKNASNDMIADRFTVKDGKNEVTVFPVVVDGKVRYVAFASSGKGFGGDMGLMVGVDVETGKIYGAGVTTHSETPGIGSRAKSEPELVNSRFAGLPIEQEFKVKNDGGQIDAISGATYTSRGLCDAATNAGKIYSKLEPIIKEKIKNLHSS